MQIQSKTATEPERGKTVNTRHELKTTPA